ncbi:MAG: PIN domain nuclease, partial [Chloroflexi bacterium]|nr:PIN domain nuclease [Chloroflexota bacterium]
MSLEFFVRLVGMAAGGWLGWYISDVLSGSDLPRQLLPWLLSLVLAGAALGLLLTPYVVLPPFRYVRMQIRQIPANLLVAGIIGMILGLIVSALLAIPLSMLPGGLGRYL